ncbi:FxsA family membrane protein [Streptomyces sp. NPDC006283]|uniref:FxsA family membrane protein n=1 Tax=Streptomyces sp. NPDC006283 TaxID=3156741 RepID=UPI0033B33F5F
MTTGAPPPIARKRSRARTFLPLGIAAWLILEIWLLTVVASEAGGLAVLGLLVGAGVLGAVVIKRAGRRAFTNLRETLQQQQTGQGAAPAASPARGEGNGLLMLGGLLLMLPGLISDVAGLLLLLPPVRTRIGRFAERSLERQMNAAMAGGLGDAFQQARMRHPDGKVVQGEVVHEGGAQRRDDNRDDRPRPPLTP